MKHITKPNTIILEERPAIIAKAWTIFNFQKKTLCLSTTKLKLRTYSTDTMNFFHKRKALLKSSKKFFWIFFWGKTTYALWIVDKKTAWKYKITQVWPRLMCKWHGLSHWGNTTVHNNPDLPWVICVFSLFSSQQSILHKEFCSRKGSKKIKPKILVAHFFYGWVHMWKKEV